MPNTILDFWFKEIKPKQHWVKDDKFDRLIVKRFTDVHRQAAQCELYQWRKTSQGRLAEIIILDQFSRNMFRETPASFQFDALALALAQEAVQAGAELDLNTLECSFLYLPFMHSESLEIHEIALKLYEKNGVSGNLNFEIRHKEIIERFGRYPHRNTILGRESTQEEIDFLKQPGSGF